MLFRSGYISAQERLVVGTEDNRVTRIGYLCEDSDYKSINRIDCGDTGEEIFEAFGKDVRVQCLKDKTDPDYVSQRAYDVVKYGVRYFLTSNKVVSFLIASPKQIETLGRGVWTACD